MKIGLISCVSTKQEGTHKAKDLYISDLFKKSFLYCSQNYNVTLILSAKYFVLSPEAEIENYNLTLNNFSKKDRQVWAVRCYNQLKANGILSNDNEIYWHCGVNYNKYLSYLIQKNYPAIKQFFPLKGLGIGNQLKWYKLKNV
jgi:hypothetical protein